MTLRTTCRALRTPRCAGALLCALCSTLALACDATSRPMPAAPVDYAQLDAAQRVDLDEPLDAGSLDYDCEIGVDVGGEDDDRYGTLAPGGEIPITGSGQAGLVALLGLRCAASDASVDEAPLAESAEVELVLTNPFTAITAPREPKPLPSPLYCAKEGGCEAVPIRIEISHLAKLPQLEGLPVRVDARVLSSDGELLGRARSHGVFTPGLYH